MLEHGIFDMSWGGATVYIQQKKTEAKPLDSDEEEEEEQRRKKEAAQEDNEDIWDSCLYDMLGGRVLWSDFTID